jgi:phage head maturation protease
VAAAYKSGLVQGTGITSFSPDASISREQMAVLLVRALVKHNKQAVLSQEEANQILTSWQDKGLVHSWAAQELATAIKLGLVKGQTASRLAPQNTATRAEAAAMVHRFIDFAKL